MEKNHPYFRRLVAWILDNVLIGVLLWLGTSWLISDKLRLDRFYEEFLLTPGVSQNLEFKQVAERLKQLSPADLEQLSQVFRQQVTAFLESFNAFSSEDLRFDDPNQLLVVIINAYNETLERVWVGSEFNAMSPQLQEIARESLLQIKIALEKLDFEQFLYFLLSQLKQLLLVVSLIPTLYFLVEVILGRSLGKLLFGLVIVRQTKTQEQTPANVVNLAFRWLIKSSGWLVFGAGVMLESWALMISALILSVVLNLGLLLMLNQDFQSLYDKLSGTGVAVKNSLKIGHLA